MKKPKGVSKMPDGWEQHTGNNVRGRRGVNRFVRKAAQEEIKQIRKEEGK